MGIKSLTVFVNPTPVGDPTVEYAVRLANKHEAHLIGVFVVPHARDKSPADGYIRGSDAVSSMLVRYEIAERDAVGRAEQSFSALARASGFSHEFRVIKDFDPGNLARLNSFYTDLVVCGHSPPNGLTTSWPPERIMNATGIPFLIVPDDWIGDRVTTNVLLAWNASREARRAVSDALPILMAAKSVAVVIVDPEKNASHGEEPGSDIAHFLSRHGVIARVEPLTSNQQSVADTLVDFALRDQSDLIVIGAYSHSHMREMILGGVTRSLLNAVRIPTLIAH